MAFDATPLFTTLKGSTDTIAVQTDNVDSSSCDLIVVALIQYVLGSITTLTDSKGNTPTARATYGNSGAKVTLFYITGSPLSVGSGHNWSVSGTGSFPTLIAMGWKVSNASPYDQEAGTTSTSGTSRSPGSISPVISNTNALMVATLAWDGANAGSAISIDNSYTIAGQNGVVGGAHYGGAMAYKIVTSASGINPAFSWSGAQTNSAGHYSFKDGTSGGGGVVVPVFMNQYRQRSA